MCLWGFRQFLGLGVLLTLVALFGVVRSQFCVGALLCPCLLSFACELGCS